jgi:hypothetical protein
MMESQDLNWMDFKKEVEKMAVSCIGLKPNTAKRKASDVFNKYRCLVSSSESDVKYYMDQSRALYHKFETLKKGSVEYKRGNVSGKLLLKDVEQIEVRESGVLIITKSGREITMGSDFKYLKDLI